jgi:3D (Asp-Asp-Asp) domain-containing protein
MDLMNVSFNKIVGTACITVLLQLSANAQNPATSQAQESNPVASSDASSTTPTSALNNNLALVSDRVSDKASDKVLDKALDKTSSSDVIEVKTETRARIVTAAVEPKVFLKNPSIQFKINPSESKLSGRLFTNPSMETLGIAASFNATAYALRGRTSSGIYVRRGVIAADPRVIPIGSVVQIITPGYSGVYTVHDTGGKIKGKIVDVWMGSPREARIFGRRKIKLHVLRWGRKRHSQR